jgi:hypothetical protein
MPLLAGRGAAKDGDENGSGILIVVRLGVPIGEWNGLDLSEKRGAAIARFELVRAMGGAMPPMYGDADFGCSETTSFHGSEGEKDVAEEVRGAETFRGEGLNVAALALSIPADATGDPAEL